MMDTIAEARIDVRKGTTREWHELSPGYDEEAFEFYAYDYDGHRHWGETSHLAMYRALEANRIIVDHARKSYRYESQAAVDRDSAS
jgi:hypothetical protein